MPAHLTRMERSILEYLAARSRHVRAEQLIEHLWNYGIDEPEHPRESIRQHIARLRRKIAFTGLIISNIPWQGYMLEVRSPAPQLEFEYSDV